MCETAILARQNSGGWYFIVGNQANAQHSDFTDQVWLFLLQAAGRNRLHGLDVRLQKLLPKTVAVEQLMGVPLALFCAEHCCPKLQTQLDRTGAASEAAMLNGMTMLDGVGGLDGMSGWTA
jgi:hypothetical protein